MIESKSEKIDIKNHKTVTKEILMDYYSLIGDMQKELSNPDLMAERNDAEHQVGKKAKVEAAESNKAKDKKKKSTCGCELKKNHDKK